MSNGKESPWVFESFLFPKIFKTFRIAVQPSKLIIAFAALTIICLSGWIMDFSGTVVAVPQTQGEATELRIYINDPDRLTSFIEDYGESGEHKGVFSTLWRFGSERFHGALKSLFAFDLPGVAENIAKVFKAIGWAFRYHYFYILIFFLITLAVVSIAGGSLCRISALQFARDEKPGVMEALRFSIKRFLSLFTVPLAPVCIIIVMGLFISVLGLIGNIPIVGELMVGIFLLLALIGGALIVTFLIGTVAGANLMFPAIVYDGSDCFDAISRSFSYVYSKPWQMGFYTAVTVIYGAICYTFVRFFTFLLLWVTYQFLQFGFWVNNSSNQIGKLAAIWPEPSFMGLRGSPPWATVNWSESFAGFLIYLVLLVVIGLLVSFVISFYFSASTIIYALMRNRVDNTALDDIYTPTTDIETETNTIEYESEKA